MRFEDMETFVTPPHGLSTDPYSPRALAITNATATQEIDNDILQAVDQAGNAVPATSGYVLVRFQAQGCDMWIRFGTTAGMTAVNPATTGNGAAVGEYLPAGTYVDYMLNPRLDKFFSCVSSGAATGILRYRLSGPAGNLKP